MPTEVNAVVINNLAIQELLNVARVYGPNGFARFTNNEFDVAPPANFIAVLEQLETATADAALLTGNQTVASVEAQIIADLTELYDTTRDQLNAVAGPGAHIANEVVAFGNFNFPANAARLEADAKLFTPRVSNPPVTVISPPPPPASGVEQYLVGDMTTGVVDWQGGQAYAGPVANLQNQFLAITTDSLSITATKPNNFIHTGAGNDAVHFSLFGPSGGGTNVVDCGGGSNFVTGSISPSASARSSSTSVRRLPILGPRWQISTTATPSRSTA